MAFDKHKELHIFKKIEKIGALEFENPKTLDNINKAVAGGNRLFWFTMTFLDIVFFYNVYFVMMGIYIYTLRPSLSSSIILIFVPSVLAYRVQVKAFKKLEEDVAPLRRKSDYYFKCMTDLKETRFLGATPYFETLYYRCLRDLNHLIFKVQLRKSLITLLMEVITVTETMPSNSHHYPFG